MVGSTQVPDAKAFSAEEVLAHRHQCEISVAQSSCTVQSTALSTVTSIVSEQQPFCATAGMAVVAAVHEVGCARQGAGIEAVQNTERQHAGSPTARHG